MNGPSWIIGHASGRHILVRKISNNYWGITSNSLSLPAFTAKTREALAIMIKDYMGKNNIIFTETRPVRFDEYYKETT